MTNTNEFLDALKLKLGAASDYAIAKKLGISTSRISNYRSGRSQFDDAMALQVASLLEIEPFIVLAAVHAERAKNPEEKAVWRSMIERLGGVAASLLVASALFAQPLPAQASQSNCAESMYIMLNI